MTETIVVIGGGAAGFFGAITCAENNPTAKVILLEKTNKLLSKVRVSGGGRCNVTHYCLNPNHLAQYYPRGGKFLKNLFKTFGAPETIAWFNARGVKLHTEPDGRMFPVSNSSETIVNCLLQGAHKAGVNITTSLGVEQITLPGSTPDGQFHLRLSNGTTLKANKVLITTGGAPKIESYQWLRDLGLRIQEPVPSLFTFNVPESPLRDLTGVAVGRAKVKISGQNLENEGPLLITHWGFSGPAVLKLSAWGARVLQQLNYQFTALINWVPDHTEESLREALLQYRQEYARRQVTSHALFNLPQRLWKALTALAGITDQIKWAELPAKNQNKLVEFLLRAPFPVKGKTTFKEEFVTCGGVDLKEVNPTTQESLKIPGLYFAGEVLDIDGVTGGFNFQAAWTTAFLAGKAMAANQNN
ncbi:NAD(P)/FAD-dependent oxidoreductase [Adhaeribacter swui]|uniref:NAD(P)/FAD-dependent oxidoreductase n=1 Tax=Adhaeribacter swui TaxID=2086471 RepID=A0A7G7GD57_9BACT|nr:NAD(P)/FAD-dependent oxidoreductase [Adhaeribacter swui]QNF35091.1 NAD(P)/FAD-dependent oxidoreductase [Adhaeribacter swui]